VVVSLKENTGTLYVDYLEVDRDENMAFAPDSQATTNYLGRGRGKEPYFKGRLDDVRIYSKALAFTPPKPAGKIEKPVLALDAYDLNPGMVQVWPNTGSLGGEFIPEATKPIVRLVDGRKAVTFQGGSPLAATLSFPAEKANRNGITVAAWVYNASVEADECILQWRPAEGKAQGIRLDYACLKNRDAPKPGLWHHVAVTYTSGENGVERVYLNGEPVLEENKVFEIEPGKAVFIAGSGEGNGFSGSLASVQVYDRALGEKDVLFLAEGGDTEPPSPDPLVWEMPPTAFKNGVVKMSAAPASDRSGVEYYVKCVEGGGADSSWQDSPAFEQTGLAEGNTYVYRVRCRDKSMNHSETKWSESVSVTVGDSLVDLDAGDLESGVLQVWKNKGTLRGEFKGQGNPIVEAVAGRHAVTFDGSSSMLSTFTAPVSITGGNPYTIAVWAHNPDISPEECMVQWAHRGADSKCAQFNYGNNDSFGAVTHWGGADLGYEGGVPKAGEWHHLVLTYEGGEEGFEKVYVDGKLNAEERKTLSLWTGDAVRLGATEEDREFTGSIASVKIFNYCLSEDEVKALVSMPK
jgi:hypothetical protein